MRKFEKWFGRVMDTHHRYTNSDLVLLSRTYLEFGTTDSELNFASIGGATDFSKKGNLTSVSCESDDNGRFLCCDYQNTPIKSNRNRNQSKTTELPTQKNFMDSSSHTDANDLQSSFNRFLQQRNDNNNDNNLAPQRQGATYFSGLIIVLFVLSIACFPLCGR